MALLTNNVKTGADKDSRIPHETEILMVTEWKR